MMKIKAYNIVWDWSDDDNPLAERPKVCEDQVEFDYDGPTDDKHIVDYLSDTIGYCVVSLDWTILDDGVKDDPHYPSRREMVSNIRAVLRRYFTHDSSGRANEEHDPCFSAEDALEEIGNIVCEF